MPLESMTALDDGPATGLARAAARGSVSAAPVGLRVFFCALVVFLGPMAWWQRHGWPVHRAMPPTSFLEHGGVAFQAAIPGSFLTRRLTDGAHGRNMSDLRLFEDARELGPNRTPAGAVESQGGGAFNDWEGSVVLSTPDGSDPRKNGRLYSAAYRAYPSIAAQAVYVAACALAALLAAEGMLLFELRPRSRLARWTGAQARHAVMAVVIYGAATAFIVLCLQGLSVRATLSPDKIDPFGGSAYRASLPTTFTPLFAASGDDVPGESWSNLTVSEDERPLGPPHAPHAQIRSEGLGAYSHWGDSVVFSATDGSDPRDNGRSYRIAYRTFPVPALTGGGLALCGSAILVRLLNRRRSVVGKYRSHSAAVKALAAANEAVVASLVPPSSLLRFGGLVIAYTAALLLLYGSLVARQSDTGGFKINFEYKAF